VLVACVLAVGGCRQVFGIEDTTVGADAPGADAAGPDAAPELGSCVGSHLFCANFDHPTTGLVRFEQQLSAGSSLREEVSGFSVSSPSVLTAAVGTGTGSAYARGLGRFPGATRAIAIAWVNVPLLGLGCTPYVLQLADPTAAAGAGVFLAADGYHIVVFDSTGTVSDSVFGSVVPGVHQIRLEVLLQSPLATVTLTAPGTLFHVEAAELAVPGLSLGEVAVGVSVLGDHGPCEVYVDDVVVDPVPP